jgi:hypothetical protein
MKRKSSTGPQDNRKKIKRERITFKSSLKITFIHGRDLDLDPDLDPDPDPQIEKNAGSGSVLNQCGSETLNLLCFNCC